MARREYEHGYADVGCSILVHGEAASPIVGRAVDAPIPEVSFSCLLILLQLARLADM